jgi:glycosyltransferase involved in cell wall biosynthesis
VNFCLDARTVHPHFPGVGRYALNLARGVATCLEPSERLMVLRDPAGAPRRDFPDADAVQVVDVALSPFTLRQQWMIPRLLRRLDAQLYHSPYYLIPFRPGMPCIVTMLDFIPMRYPQFFTPVQRLVFALSVRLAARAARLIIALSAATARDVERFLRVAPERIVIVPAAADPVFRPRSVAEVAALSARLQLPQRYVLYVGSNKPHKNLVRLIDAWARLQPQPFPLVLAGPWDARYPDAKQRVASLDLGAAVRFLGAVTAADLPVLYAGALALVLPSEFEGFGFPVVEAMACGVPVVCSNTASLPEVAGDAAVLFDPLDAEAMARAIGAVLDDAGLQAELKRRGAERAAQLSWEQTAQATLRAYRRLLA